MATIAAMRKRIQSQPREERPAGVGSPFGGVSRGADSVVWCRWGVTSVYDRPVPGTPTVVRIPPSPNVTCAPRTPIDTDALRLPKFRRRPGAVRNDRRNRKRPIDVLAHSWISGAVVTIPALFERAAIIALALLFTFARTQSASSANVDRFSSSDVSNAMPTSS